MPPAQGRASSDDHADGGDGVESVTPRAIRREGSLAHLYRWYVARLHRVIVTYWVAMLLTMAVEFWAARTVHPLSELVPCAFLVATWQANATIPNWRSCPNGPAWYISALVPSWLLFPFAAPLIRLGMRRHLLAALVALPLLSALSVLPVSYTMRQPGFDRPDANPANLMFYFPPANLADFYAGACAAALAKLHRPTVARLLAVTTAPPANYTTILWAWRHRAEIVWAWAADIAIYTLAPHYVQWPALRRRRRSTTRLRSGSPAICTCRPRGAGHEHGLWLRAAGVTGSTRFTCTCSKNRLPSSLRAPVVAAG